MSKSVFIEVDYFNRFKTRKVCSGDVFLSERSADESDVIAILTDGLGSGQQANVAASLTATMAQEYMRANLHPQRAAELIMDALPICPDRHISYSTFTMIRARSTGDVEIIEYENPHAILCRGNQAVKIERTPYSVERWNGRTLHYATFQMQKGDRLFFCSDGVTQAGLGTAKYPFGWGRDAMQADLLRRIGNNEEITARELCREMVNAATSLDGGVAGDDTTAAVLHYREPRILQILTGPPFNREHDFDYANLVNKPGIKSIVSGGSTAELVARQLGRTLDTQLTDLDPEIPASSTMQGVTLVTEGCITLSKVMELLKSGEYSYRKNAATQMRDLLLDSDKILIAVGTAINPAHQDPNLPVELDIRRNIIKKLTYILRKVYFKAVEVTYY